MCYLTSNKIWEVDRGWNTGVKETEISGRRDGERWWRWRGTGSEIWEVWLWTITRGKIKQSENGGQEGGRQCLRFQTPFILPSVIFPNHNTRYTYFSLPVSCLVNRSFQPPPPSPPFHLPVPPLSPRLPISMSTFPYTEQLILLLKYTTVPCRCITWNILCMFLWLTIRSLSRKSGKLNNRM